MDQKISKYLRGTATSREGREVQDWVVSSDKNAKRFNIIKAKYVASTMDTTDVELNPFYHSKINTQNKSRLIFTILTSAAVLVLLVAVTYMFNDNISDSSSTPIISEDAITLQLSDGRVEVISEDGTAKVVDTEGNVLGAQQGRNWSIKRVEVPKGN